MHNRKSRQRFNLDRQKSRNKRSFKTHQNIDVEKLVNAMINATTDEDQNRILRQLPAEKRMILTKMFVGPLPPPDYLAAYEKILPGTANRLLKMAEIQIKHTQETEKSLLRVNAANSLLGIVFAFLLGFLIIGGGIYLSSMGSHYGSWLTIGGAVSLISIFVYGTRLSNKNTKKWVLMF